MYRYDKESGVFHIVEEGELPPSSRCVVAKVVDESPNCERGLKGTKHFGPSAKVYVSNVFPNEYPLRVAVIGHHRKSGRYIRVITKVTNFDFFKIADVYSPKVMAILSAYWGSVSVYEERVDNIYEHVSTYIE